MVHYKVLKEDGSLDLIGTEEVLTEGHVEITNEEYDSLFLYIREHAVHINAEEENYQFNQSS